MQRCTGFHGGCYPNRFSLHNFDVVELTVAVQEQNQELISTVQQQNHACLAGHFDEDFDLIGSISLAFRAEQITAACQHCLPTAA